MQEPLISLTAFQVLALLHALGGFIIGMVIWQDDFKPFLLKKHSNPLTATLIYYLMLIGSWSLLVVGYVAVIIPEISKMAVIFSWLSLSTVFVASLVEFITYRSKPQFNKLSAVSVAIRLLGAYFLTITAP
jgi:hypothetical protein